MSTRAEEKRCPGPDQGAGWLIAMACFFINFICAGLARTAGVLFVALIELYGVSREAATTPFSIRVCVRNMTGPLIGLLGLKYGIRAVTTCGGFVAALGSILCYFAPDVMWITVFWGVIHGVGFGLSTVLHMMMIGLYFEKYKASALGLGYSGDCFGTFAFPVIMEHLLGTYDVQGTFLILGGIVLHVIPLALLLKKPPWMRDNRQTGNFTQNIARQNVLNGTKGGDYQNSAGYKNEAFVTSRDDLSSLGGNLAEEGKSNNPGFEKDDPPVYQEVVVTDRRVNCLRYESSSMTGSLRSYGNHSDISEFMRENMERHESLPPVLEKETTEGDNQLSESFSISGDIPPIDGPKTETVSQGVQHSESMKKPRTPSFMGQMAHEIVHRMRTASFASQVAQDGFICNLQQDQLPEEEESPQQDLCNLKEAENGSSVTDKIKSPLTNLPTEKDVKINLSGNTDSSHRLRQTKKPSVFKTLMHTNTKPIFVLISMTMAVFVFLFVGVLTIIIDYAADHGVSQEKGKFLIIGFSVTDLIGRLSFGQVIDRKLVKLKNYAGVTTLLMGVMVGAIPLNPSYNYMIVCMCMYGLVQGGAAIMFPILVSYYMEKNEESVAMGCLNFYGGLLMLGLAPMIGYFRDSTGSYNGVFYILGGLMALVGIVWQFEPLIIKFQNRHKRSHVPQTKL